MSKGGKNARVQRSKGKQDKYENKQTRERGGTNHRWERQGGQEDARPKFQRTVFENIEDVRNQEAAIAELKARDILCPICGKRIEDMEYAISDRQSGKPAHFDCIISRLSTAEDISEGESIVYIGQGTFAVMRYDNKEDPKTFHIVRKIEWENTVSSIPWRHEISALFSQVL